MSEAYATDAVAIGQEEPKGLGHVAKHGSLFLGLSLR